MVHLSYERGAGLGHGGDHHDDGAEDASDRAEGDRVDRGDRMGFWAAAVEAAEVTRAQVEEAIRQRNFFRVLQGGSSGTPNKQLETLREETSETSREDQSP